MYLFLLALLCLRCGKAQPLGFGQPPEEKAPVIKSDIKFINCQTCEVLIREANRAIRSLKNEAKPGKKVIEADVFTYLEKICNPDSDEGEWIATIDIVEDGTKLKLMDMDTIGHCGTECRTIERACSDLLEEIDYNLAEALFKGVEQRAALTQRFCREETDVCNKKPPPVPKDRPKGPPFIPMTEEDYKMAKMMQQMKGMGLGGQVFDQDSARRFIAENSGAYDEDDEDEEDEETSESASSEESFLRRGYETVSEWGKGIYQSVLGKKGNNPEL